MFAYSQKVEGIVDRRHRIQPRPRRHAAKLTVGGRHDGALRIGDSQGFRAVTGNNARHVRAVTIGVHQTLHRVTDNPNGQASHGPKIRMLCINAGVVHFHRYIFAGQPQIICCHLRIRRHADGGAAQVVGGHTRVRRFDDLHRGHLRQRHHVALALHREHFAKGRWLLRHDGPTRFYQRRFGFSGGVLERRHIEGWRQRLVLQNLSQQRGLNLVIRFVGNDCLRQWIPRQSVRAAL